MTPTRRAALALAFLSAALPAQAAQTLRIAEQFGISYLPFHVIRDRGLIEKHAAARGVSVTAEWTQLGGGGAANDALLSGSVDVVAAGLGPLLTIWDRTRGSFDVKGIAGLARVPFALVTANPDVRTIADLTAADRIAVPTVGVSVQARTLQWAAAQLWGIENQDRLDAFTVTLPHPDAAQALLSGSGSVNGHFSNVPFQQQELRAPGVHKITDWYEVAGGPATSVTVYATSAWRAGNPDAYGVFVDALREAGALIQSDPEAAADAYLRVSGSKLDRDLVLGIIRDPAISFDPVPLNTEGFAHFLHDIGAITVRPESWRDYFFDDLAGAEGS